MREIKFRGYNGEKWLFGNLDIDYKAKQACISDNRFWRHPVRFETVGQFSGLMDSNGKEIYEGDIVKFCDDRAHELIGVIKWYARACRWGVDCSVSVRGCDHHPFDVRYAFEIIGNIYDNFDTTTFICWRLNHELPAEHHARRSAADDMECVVVDGKTREEIGDA